MSALPSRKIIDRAGNRCGRLLVLEYAGLDKDKHAHWRCRCDCGNELIVAAANLARGAVRSCGCLRKGMPLVWKDKHGAAFREAWTTGRPAAEIAERFGMHKASVSNLARRMGLPGRFLQWGPERQAEFREAWVDGWPARKIQQHFGLKNAAAVSGRVKDLGLPIRHKYTYRGSKPWTEADKALFAKLWYAELPYRAIAVTLRRTMSSVIAMRPKLRLLKRNIGSYRPRISFAAWWLMTQEERQRAAEFVSPVAGRHRITKRGSKYPPHSQHIVTDRGPA